MEYISLPTYATDMPANSRMPAVKGEYNPWQRTNVLKLQPFTIFYASLVLAGQHKGFAFVEFATAEEAKACCAAFSTHGVM